MSNLNDLGCGSGKGGGAGGAIRESGGAFGRLGSAKEEQYFRNVEAEKIENLAKILKQKAATEQISSLKQTKSDEKRPE